MSKAKSKALAKAKGGKKESESFTLPSGHVVYRGSAVNHMFAKKMSEGKVKKATHK